jgi:hypothetical protein
MPHCQKCSKPFPTGAKLDGKNRNLVTVVIVWNILRSETTTLG